MNQVSNKDFILDCLKMVDDITGDIRGNFGTEIDFNENIRNARNFINSLPDEAEEYSYPVKTINPKEIMQKFDLVIEQLR